MLNKAVIALTATMLSFFAPSGGLLAQTEVVSVSPAPHALNAGENETILIEIEGRMISNETLQKNIFIYGSQSGLHRQDSLVIERDEENKVSLVNHLRFKPGELISVIIKEYRDAEIGFHLHPSYQWQFSVRPESGTGEFKRRDELNLPSSSEAVAAFAADLNNNGIPDLAVLDGNSGTVSIFANRSTNMGLGFGKDPVRNIPVQPEQSVVRAAAGRPQQMDAYPHITGGDLYGNGYPVLIVTSEASGEIILYRNVRDETDNDRPQKGDDYDYLLQPLPTGPHPLMSHAADFDNDGKTDIAVLAAGNGRVMIHTNEEDFLNPTSYEAGNEPVAMVAGDFNNDGYLDVVVSAGGPDQLTYLQNDRSGGFEKAVATSLPFAPGPLIAGNFTGSVSDGAYGDEHIELIVSSKDSDNAGLYIFEEGSGQFIRRQSLSPTSPAPAVTLASGDFYGDTTLDLISASRTYDHLDLFTNNRNEELGPAQRINPDPSSSPPFGAGIAIADFALNGSMDLAVTNSYADKVTILYNDAGARPPAVTKGEVTAFPNPFTPNADGYNDRTGFHLNDTGGQAAVLEMYTLEGRRIRTSRNLEQQTLFWDGRNDDGRMQLPGVYIYVVKESSEIIGSGVVTLAR